MSKYTPEQMKKHVEIMQDFLHFLNLKTNHYVLKDGTALLFGYNLDRFSEDLDFDSVDPRTFKDVLDELPRAKAPGIKVTGPVIRSRSLNCSCFSHVAVVLLRYLCTVVHRGQLHRPDFPTSRG